MGDDIGAPDEKRMRLRYAGTCRSCSAALPRGVEALYDRTARTVRCLACSGAAPQQPEPAPAEPVSSVDPGVAGASARRELERRQARREQRVRTKHKRLGGLILAMSDDPQSTKAWGTGAAGEERVGARLDGAAGELLKVLHDRRVPRSTANIDHLAVTPAGVFVVDTKRYRGRPRLVVEGGLLRPRVERLEVGGRDRTALVDGVHRQVDVVRGLLDEEVPVRGVLCFVDADWPLVGGSFVVRGVEALWPKKLLERLRAPGPLETDEVEGLHRLLAARLRPAG